MADQASGNRPGPASGNSSEPPQRQDGGAEGRGRGNRRRGGGGGRGAARGRGYGVRGGDDQRQPSSSNEATSSQQPGEQASSIFGGATSAAQNRNASANNDDNASQRGDGSEGQGGGRRRRPPGKGRGQPRDEEHGGEGGGRGGGRRRGGSPRAQRRQAATTEGKDGQFEDSAEGKAEAKGKGFDLPPADSDDVCFICANPVIYNSIAPCGHTTCHICALRMRALYKSKACPHCRTNWDHVVFSLDNEKPYSDFAPKDIVKTDDNLGIKYDSMTIYEDTVLLLRYNCPEPTCDVACMGWPDLHRHVRNVHHQRLCDLCTRNKKVFCHEHTLFTDQELRMHERHGDDKPGSSEQSGFRGHPECGFCRRRFYGDDELYQHCKEHHETCFICDRNARDNNDKKSQWFLDFEAVSEHFKKDHYQCPEEECLEKKFEVWETEYELRVHQREHHPNGLTSKAMKDSRKIDLSTLPGLNQPGSYGRDGRGRGGRGRGGQQAQAQEQPAAESSSQGMNRAQNALQRQMQVQSAQSVTTRQFGSQMSAAPAPAPAPQQPQQQQAAQAPPPAPAPAANGTETVFAAAPSLPDAYRPRPMVLPPGRTQTSDFPPLANLNIRDPPRHPPESSKREKKARDTSTPISGSQPGSSSNLVGEADEARLRKHAPTIARASFMLRNDERKIARFKAYVGRYKEGSMSAKELIDAFWSLFDVKAAELGTLLREVADLYEEESKAIELRKAWNAWRVVNEDYPPIAGAASSAAQAAAEGHAKGSRRVLNIKSATTKNLQSGKSPWGAFSSSNTSNPASKLSHLVAAGPASNPNRTGAGRAPATAWAGATVASSSSAASSKPAPRIGGGNDFPSLPPKQLFPNGFGPVPRKNEGSAPTSVWGAGGGGGGGGDDNNYNSDQGQDGGGGGGGGESSKKKGKKKQTLMHFG